MQAPLWKHAISQLGETSTISLSGELDLSACQDVQDLITNELRKPDLRRLLIDMSEVTFIDSSVLGALVYAHKAAHGADRQLTVTPSRFVRRILDVTGLTHLLALADR